MVVTGRSGQMHTLEAALSDSMVLVLYMMIELLIHHTFVKIFLHTSETFLQLFTYAMKMFFIRDCSNFGAYT